MIFIRSPSSKRPNSGVGRMNSDPVQCGPSLALKTPLSAPCPPQRCRRAKPFISGTMLNRIVVFRCRGRKDPVPIRAELGNAPRLIKGEVWGHDGRIRSGLDHERCHRYP